MEARCQHCRGNFGKCDRLVITHNSTSTLLSHVMQNFPLTITLFPFNEINDSINSLTSRNSATLLRGTILLLNCTTFHPSENSPGLLSQQPLVNRNITVAYSYTDMSLPPPCITYRVIHAESSGVITEEGIHAGYSTCHGLGNNLIIYPYRFNHHMNKDNREVQTCYISTTNCLLWALLTALRYQQQGKMDIVLVMIDIDKALECGDIIFHAKDLGRSFGHANCSKWVWEYLFHNRISTQGVIGSVSLNDLLERGLFEIFPAFSKTTASTRLEQLRETIMLDFFYMRKQQCHQTLNLETGSWDWREWYDTGRKCGEFASCFRLPPNKDPLYPVWLAQEAVNWKGPLAPHILRTQPESLEEFRDGQFLYIAKPHEPFN